MADEDLRRLEREAATGDAGAAARLARERARLGRFERWVEVARWPVRDVRELLFTPDGGYLVVASRGGVSVVDASGRTAGTGPLDRVVAAVSPGLFRVVTAVATDGRRLLVGEGYSRADCAGTNDVVAYALPGGERLATLGAFAEDVDAVAASLDGRAAAVAFDVRVWGAGGETLHAWRSIEPGPKALRLSGEDLVWVDARRLVRRRAADGVEALVADDLLTCALSSDGAYAATGHAGAVDVVRLGPPWSAVFRRAVPRTPRVVTLGGAEAIGGAGFVAFSLSNERDVHLFDVAAARLVATIEAPFVPRLLALSPRAHLLAASGVNEVVLMSPAS